MKTKNYMPFRVLLFAAGILLAPVISAQENIFIGLYPEVNAHTRDTSNTVSLGGGLLIGLGINQHFSAGIKTSFFYDLKTVSALEPQAFFRYCLPWRKENNGPYIQAEAGSIIYWEFGEVFPAFSGGLALGWRFSFAKNWYAEPIVRFGYPYIWGAGAAIGYKFNLKENKKQGGEKQ